MGSLSDREMKAQESRAFALQPGHAHRPADAGRTGACTPQHHQPRAGRSRGVQDFLREALFWYRNEPLSVFGYKTAERLVSEHGADSIEARPGWPEPGHLQRHAGRGGHASGVRPDRGVAEESGFLALVRIFRRPCKIQIRPPRRPLQAPLPHPNLPLLLLSLAGEGRGEGGLTPMACCALSHQSKRLGGSRSAGTSEGTKIETHENQNAIW